MGGLTKRIANSIRRWAETISPNPEVEMWKDLARVWERSARDTLMLLDKANQSFKENMIQTKTHYSVLERSYSSYIANNAGIKVKLRMEKEWPERYEVVVSVPPQLGLYLMDKKWNLSDKEIHISNFSRAVAEQTQIETYNYLANHIIEKETQP